MWTYYSILWAVSLLNVLRCLAQIGSLSPQLEGVWNVVWLINRFGESILKDCRGARKWHLPHSLGQTACCSPFLGHGLMDEWTGGRQDR